MAIYTWEHIERIRQYPHLLGHLAGKKLLTELHSAWMLYIWDTQDNRSLQAHRGSYKTTCLTEIGPIWWLLFHPNDRIGIMRKGFAETWSIAEAIVNYMMLPEISALFEFVHGKAPKVKKKNSSSGTITFNFKESVEKEGSLNIYGVESGITGAHLDRFIADDIVTLKDKNSAAERKRTIDIIREVQSNIMEPGQPFSMIGTPWHKQDAWTIAPTPLKFPWKTTNILTTDDINNKKQLTTKRMFSINYELEHTDNESAIFTNPLIERWEHNCQNVVAQLDAKYSGDCTGALTIKAERADGITQIRGMVFEQHIDEVTDKIVDVLKTYKVAVLYMELNADKGYLAKIFQTKFNENGMRTNTKTYQESQNKHVKIVSYLKPKFNSIIWSKDNDTQEYLSQILDYEEGEKPDDCADSAASLLREYSGLTSALLGMSKK